MTNATIIASQIKYVNLESVSQNLNALEIRIVFMDIYAKIKNALTNVVSIFACQLKYANLETALINLALEIQIVNLEIYATFKNALTDVFSIMLARQLKYANLENA